MNRHPSRALLAIVLLSLVAAPACRPWRSPASPYRRVETEPRLSVFVHETRETQEMPMEEYLLGVVAGEMEPDWPLEALKAQAVLARTFTIEALQRKGGTRESTGTDVSTSETEFQAYDASKISDIVRRAVAETRGQILVDGRGNPVRAYFHADAGGKTATADEGLGFREVPTSYLKVNPAPSNNPDASWTASFSLAEIATAVRQVKPGANLGQVNRVAIAARGPSGRATQIQVGNVRVSAVALRMALGPKEMKSTMLESLTLGGGQVTMKGRGFGHGVGMPQWSARLLADQGTMAAAILGRFFAGTRVDQWWR
ncbi:MAG: SpoIID/LytB domain-containing protein [Bacillota bacterium]|nr:SpoIID/LytB domain-containing protein [Bacillota bacterium]